MPEDERQHKKKLKEAKKVYEKNFKAFSQGKITKDELKDKLRPYKYELKELGYPVKIKDDDGPSDDEKGKPGEESTKKSKPVKAPVSYRTWAKRSSLTTEEIERNIDILSLGSSTSESLKSLYKSKYGEELPPPEDLIPFEKPDKELPATRPRSALPSADVEAEDTVAGEKRSFWKSLVKGQKEKGKEET
ncbi:MAG: hypothetical protein ACMUHY_03200 [Thermoplasmatota archaeon]